MRQQQGSDPAAGGQLESWFGDGTARVAGDDPTTIRELIDRMAATRPDAVFLISPESGRSSSFGDLRAASLSIARRLEDLELRAGDKVAFAIDNGLVTIELLLGAMYGGFVPVPLNVKAGPGHLAYVLDHSDARMVFASSQHRALIDEARRTVDRSIDVVPADIDELAHASAEPAESWDTHPPAPADEALLLYTSGSTGRPKGVVHSQRSLIRCAFNGASAHGLTGADRSLLVLPICHANAVSVTVLPSLWKGGSIVVPRGFRPRRFWEWMARYCCTWSSLVPTIISELTELEDAAADASRRSLERIRFLRSSSGPLSPALHQRFVERFGVPLVQAMGLTEAGNVFSNPPPPEMSKAGSVGRPFGFDVRIVDRGGVDVGRGEAGEILVRGPSVMVGYYKDTEATESALDAGGWLRTGDLARVDDDGYFFVVGRSKEIIIKAGVNIAPQEIDDVLGGHPGVLEAAAVAVPDAYLGEDIRAFVVARPGAALDERELLDYCEGRLGSFKAPSRIGFLAELPKGPSGKVQRLRLLDEGMLAVFDDAPMHAVTNRLRQVPEGSEMTPIEKVIAEVWSGLLGVERLERESDFFALGGYSLLALESVSLLRRRMPVVLTLSDVLANPTIAALGCVARARLSLSARSAGGIDAPSSPADLESALLGAAAASAAEPTIPRSDASRRYRLTCAQEALWHLGQDAGNPVYNECEAVRLRGPLRAGALEEAFDVLVSRHEVLRSTIHADDAGPVAVVHDSLPLTLRRIALTERAEADLEEELGRLLRVEARRPFRLESEAGIRVTLVELGREDHVLLLMMHHAISDRSSFGNVWREVAAVYSALARGDSVSLSPLSCQYGDYAVWKSLQSGSESVRAALEYWRRTLDGAPAFLDLTAGRPRPPAVPREGEKRHFRIEPALSERLRELGRRERASLFAVFAASFNVLLHRLSCRDEIVLGIPVAERGLPELQPLIGYLINLHALRVDLRGNPSFQEVLRRVRGGLSGIALHGHVSFPEVVQALGRERHPEHSPVFQVTLNWRDRDAQMCFIGLDGVRAEPIQVDTGTAKFDLGLVLTDVGPGHEIRLEVEYRADLFDGARIARWMDHFRVLLERVSEDAGTPLAGLLLLSELERERLLEACGASAPARRKFDRQALPAPGAVASRRPSSGAAPVTPVEKRLAAIWAAVLGTDRVTLDDNFLDLGGDSLAGMRSLARTQTEFGVRLSIQELFDFATLADCAREIEALQRSRK